MNKFNLGIVFVLVFSIVSVFIYYSKDSKERDREKKQDTYIRCIIPGFLLGLLVVFFLWKKEKKNQIFLEEDFWD